MIDRSVAYALLAWQLARDSVLFVLAGVAYLVGYLIGTSVRLVLWLVVAFLQGYRAAL